MRGKLTHSIFECQERHGSSPALDSGGEIRACARSFQEDLVVFDAEGEEEIHPGPDSEIEVIYQTLVLGTRGYVANRGSRRDWWA